MAGGSLPHSPGQILAGLAGTAGGAEEGGHRSVLAVAVAVAAGLCHCYHWQHCYSWQGRASCFLATGGHCGSATESAAPAGAASGLAAEAEKDGARGSCRDGCCHCPWHRLGTRL